MSAHAASFDLLDEEWWDPRGRVALLHELNPLRADYYRETLRARSPVPRPLVLDVACGGGLLAEALADRDCDVVGIDTSWSSLRVARRRGLARYVRGDAHRLPFGDAVFDGVICSQGIAHLDWPPALLHEAARVLRPGGVFGFDTPNRTRSAHAALFLDRTPGRLPLGGRRYEWLLRPDELASLCASAGLSVRDLRGIVPAGPAAVAIARLALRRPIGGFRLSNQDLRFVYIGHATLAAAGTGV